MIWTIIRGFFGQPSHTCEKKVCGPLWAMFEFVLCFRGKKKKQFETVVFFCPPNSATNTGVKDYVSVESWNIPIRKCQLCIGYKNCQITQSRSVVIWQKKSNTTGNTTEKKNLKISWKNESKNDQLDLILWWQWKKCLLILKLGMFL